MSDFFEELTEILELDETVDVSYALGEEWDSLAIVSTIALVDETYGIFLEGEDLGHCKSVQDILDLIAKKKQT
jgi:acyl carrier protein